jgi:DTW domain-containing protein YfiP
MSRKSSRPRCPTCGLHLELCLCAGLPVRDLSSDFVVVQHNRERNKPTSTGRVTAAVLRAPILNYGAQDELFDPRELERPNTDYYVLYPLEGSAIVDDISTRPAPGRRRCFVILDGTWHQCSRMARRAPRVEAMPHLALPPGPPRAGACARRRTPQRCAPSRPRRGSSRLLHGPEAAAPMTAFFTELSARMLGQRGRVVDRDAED